MERARVRPNRHSAAGDAFMRALRMDHARLSRVLREIDIQQARLTVAPTQARPVLVEAMHYLLHYQHAFHHPREDRLFARIAQRAPRLGRAMRALVREHRGGLRQAESLATDLTGARLVELRRAAGVRLAARVRRYVAHTREHMRSEEAAFYAQSERVLTDADWSALQADAVPDDPAGSPQRLARDYPQLAACLASPERDVSAAGDASAAGEGGAAARARAAVSDGMEQLVELYGDLIHEGLGIARSNLAGLWSVRSPWDLVRAAMPIGARSAGFAARCLADPPRLALAAFAQVIAALRPANGVATRERGSA